jgi:DNA-binding CsgD family transcriptional regulator
MTSDRRELLARVQSLSALERQVLEMASRGMTNIEVAGVLRVSVHAIKFHLASVYRKLGVTNRTQASGFLYEAGAAGGSGGEAAAERSL